MEILGLRVSLHPRHFVVNRFAEAASMSLLLPGAAFESRARASSLAAEPGVVGRGKGAPTNVDGYTPTTEPVFIDTDGQLDAKYYRSLTTDGRSIIPPPRLWS